MNLDLLKVQNTNLEYQEQFFLKNYTFRLYLSPAKLNLKINPIITPHVA